MSSQFADSARAQRGDALLEALIGILIMTAVSLGAAYALARALNAQRYTSTQQQTVVAMRQLLSTDGVSGLCLAGTSTVDSQEVVASCDSNSSIVVDPKGTDGITSLGLSATIPSTTVLSSLATTSSEQTQLRYGGDGVVSISP